MCTLTERRWLIVAFQTSCAAAGGLNCLPDVVADDEGRELVQHGSALFPIACYEEDLKSYSVAWHWHEEFEYILAVKGPLAVDVSKARLVLQTGQGVFVNSGVFHAVEQAETGDALLHSGVFHPRLIGGMDTIFWQKLVHPLLQPGAPAFFLLDEADDGQKAVLCHCGKSGTQWPKRSLTMRIRRGTIFRRRCICWECSARVEKQRSLSRSRSRPSA